jgi:ubiquinone/menaquinone biosynthesis C-methylase UbiE
VIAALNDRSARRVADIACGTGILADRIARQLRPDEIYAVGSGAGARPSTCPSKMARWTRSSRRRLFTFFDQPAAVREFHRVLAPGGLAAVATLSPRWTLPVYRLSASRFNPAHNPSPAEMRALFQGAGFHVSDQHRVRRPAWTRLLSDLITFGVRP